MLKKIGIHTGTKGNIYIYLGNLNLSNRCARCRSVTELLLKERILKQPSDVLYEVSGNFNISRNDLNDFRGSPVKVDGSLIANFNKFSVIDFLPDKINGELNLSDCRLNSKVDLSSVRGLSKIILDNNSISKLILPLNFSGLLSAYDNLLTQVPVNLNPVRMKAMDISLNRIRFLSGLPQIIEDYFFISDNELIDLKGVSDEVTKFQADYNRIINLDWLPRKSETISLQFNKIEKLPKNIEIQDLKDFYLNGNPLQNPNEGPMNAKVYFDGQIFVNSRDKVYLNIIKNIKKIFNY